MTADRVNEFPDPFNTATTATIGKQTRESPLLLTLVASAPKPKSSASQLKGTAFSLYLSDMTVIDLCFDRNSSRVLDQFNDIVAEPLRLGRADAADVQQVGGRFR